MNGLADELLVRRLVERAVPVVAPVEAPDLGIGMRVPARGFSVPGAPRATLPRSAEGLASLRAALALPLAVEADHAGLWRTILSTPTLAVELEPPPAGELAIGSFGDVGTSSENVRRLALAAVITQSGRSGENLAGIATFVFRHEPGFPERTQAAWVSSTWATTTRAFMEQLEHLWWLRVAQPKSPTRHRAVVLTTSANQNLLDEQARLELEAVSDVNGITLSYVDLEKTNFDSALRSLRANLPRYLLVLSPWSEATLNLSKQYSTASNNGSVLLVDAGSTSAAATIVNRFRERFAEIRGISGSLALSEAERESAPSPAERPVLPVLTAGQCLHTSGAGRAYVEDTSDGRWWTRDDAQHGGSIFKVYTAVGRQLIHQACTDKDGVAIPKHKSPIGSVIDRNDLHSCGGPPHVS